MEVFVFFSLLITIRILLITKRIKVQNSQCFLTPVFTLAILTVVMLTGITMTTVRTVSAWLAGQVRTNCLALLYNAKDAASFYSGRWNIGINPDLAFASVVQTVAYRIDVSLTSSPGHNIDPRLLHHQGLLWQCQACLLSDGTSARPNEVTTLL